MHHSGVEGGQSSCQILTIIHRYFILLTISLEGVLHLNIIAGTWTAVEFRKYVEVLLAR